MASVLLGMGMQSAPRTAEASKATLAYGARRRQRRCDERRFGATDGSPDGTGRPLGGHTASSHRGRDSSQAPCSDVADGVDLSFMTRTTAARAITIGALAVATLDMLDCVVV